MLVSSRSLAGAEKASSTMWEGAKARVGCLDPVASCQREKIVVTNVEDFLDSQFVCGLTSD